MSIDSVHRTNRVTVDRLLDEATRWGMSRRRARQVLAALPERLPTAVVTAREQTPGPPDEIAVVVASQMTQLRDGLADWGLR